MQKMGSSRDSRWIACSLFVAAVVLAASLARATEPVADDACPEVPGLKAVLDSAGILLIGELHGTVESPAFTAAVVCRAVASGKPVTVGLEWVESEADRVEAYLGSDGGPEARSALLSGEIWQATGEAQYGATSEAMVELLDELRELRRGGRQVGVVLFNRYGTGSKDREQSMAEALGERVVASPDDLFVVLTGNVHSRVAPGTPWNPDYQPMGLLLRQQHPELEIVALDVAHAGGSAWLCVSGEPCGLRRQGPRAESDAERFTISLHEEVQPYGHHGRYFVGPIQASPPAVEADE